MGTVAKVSTFVTYLIIPFALDFILTLYILIISIFLGLPFLLLNKTSHNLGKLSTSTANRLIGITNETIQAAKIIIGFGTRKHAISNNMNALNKHVDVTIKSQIVGSLTNLFFTECFKSCANFLITNIITILFKL